MEKYMNVHENANFPKFLFVNKIFLYKWEVKFKIMNCQLNISNVLLILAVKYFILCEITGIPKPIMSSLSSRDQWIN